MSEQQFCTECGAKLDPDEKFCAECGAAAEHGEPVQAEKPRRKAAKKPAAPKDSEALEAAEIKEAERRALATQEMAGLHMKGDYDGAIAILDREIAAYPDSPSDYFSRGQCYSDKGDYARAASDFKKALELQPDNTRCQKDLAAAESAAAREARNK